MPQSNTLYLTILPMIHVSANQMIGFGLTEEVLTLMPTREFATEFFSDEADTYMQLFVNRTKYMTGGHVTGYQCEKLRTDDGRFVIKVIQYVAE